MQETERSDETKSIPLHNQILFEKLESNELPSDRINKEVIREKRAKRAERELAGEVVEEEESVDDYKDDTFETHNANQDNTFGRRESNYSDGEYGIKRIRSDIVSTKLAT